jgi:hypothetical protein
MVILRDLKIICSWKCHKETSCEAILNKQKCHFFSSTKSEKSREEQVLPGGGLVVVEGGGGRERM